MKKVLIIYHSQTGNTGAMAKAVAEGASAAGATVIMKKAGGGGRQCGGRDGDYEESGRGQ